MIATLAAIKDPKPKEKPQKPKASPESDERYTPLEMIQAARFTLGEIVLDPCSSEQAQETVDAQRWIGREEDGMAEEWIGSVWLSPPVERQGEFVEKACAGINAGKIKQALMLVDSCTREPWFHRALNLGVGLCLVKDDLGFVHEDDEPFPQEMGQSLIYCGQYNDRFYSAFDKFGVVLIWG